MALASVADYITSLTDRIGVDDAATRARCLGWLQAAELKLWGMRDWSFKQAVEQVSVVGGTDLYALSVRSNYLYSVSVDEGAPLTFVERRVFAELCSSNPLAGTPVLWTQTERLSDGFPQFRIWPVPASSGGTIDVAYDVLGKVLSDSGASFSQFPVDDRVIILERALIDAADRHKWTAEKPGLVADFEAHFARLESLDDKQPRYTRA